jgi:hypothetical protein
MTQADSVHSTPPTNTSALPDDPARRHFLLLDDSDGEGEEV